MKATWNVNFERELSAEQELMLIQEKGEHNEWYTIIDKEPSMNGFTYQRPCEEQTYPLTVASSLVAWGSFSYGLPTRRWDRRCDRDVDGEILGNISENSVRSDYSQKPVVWKTDLLQYWRGWYIDVWLGGQVLLCWMKWVHRAIQGVVLGSISWGLEPIP